MLFSPLCMQLRLDIYILDLIVTEKQCVDQVSIEKSFKDGEKNDFCYTMKFPPYRQNRRHSTQKRLFSDPQKRFALFLGLCAPLRSMSKPLWLLHKIGYFS